MNTPAPCSPPTKSAPHAAPPFPDEHDGEVNKLMKALTARDVQRSALFDRPWAEVASIAPGWSGSLHWGFFRAVVSALRPKHVLMLGVYQGRDLALLKKAQLSLRPIHPMFVTAVDRFEEGACSDWPTHLVGRSWQEAGYGPPPSAEAARYHLHRLGIHQGFTIITSDDARFLAETPDKYDFIYLDTAHDRNTVARQLRQIRQRGLAMGPETVIAGDDYADTDTWGVRTAVSEAFTRHGVTNANIWFSCFARLQA